MEVNGQFHGPAALPTRKRYFNNFISYMMLQILRLLSGGTREFHYLSSVLAYNVTAVVLNLLLSR